MKPKDADSFSLLWTKDLEMKRTDWLIELIFFMANLLRKEEVWWEVFIEKMSSAYDEWWGMTGYSDFEL